MNRFNNVFIAYYESTIGRFYSAEQRQRILRLIALSNGINAGTKDFTSILEAANTVDAQNISDYTESRNFKILCDLSNEDDALRSAAAALVAVYREIEHDRGPTLYETERDWLMHLHTTSKKTQDVYVDLGLLSYVGGNMADAIGQLETLVNEGDMTVVELLAIMCVENHSFEAAYHYFSLMYNVYVNELKVKTRSSAWIKNYMDAIEIRIAGEKAERIRANTAALAPLFVGKRRGDKPSVGFLNGVERRFSYEA